MLFVKKVLSSVSIGAACLLCLPAQAHEAGEWFIRAGIATVAPDESSGIIQPTVISPNGQVSIDNDTQLGLTATYMLTDNFGVEILAATPFKHTVSFAGDLQGLGSLATAEHLPPTVSAQYFFNTTGKFMPYVGAGVNYTLMLSTKITENGANVLDSLDISDHSVDADDSFGLTAQIGFDYELNDNLLLNAAVWYMDIDTTIEVANAVKVDLDIDPWVYMVGVGYKF